MSPKPGGAGESPDRGELPDLTTQPSTEKTAEAARRVYERQRRGARTNRRGRRFSPAPRQGMPSFDLVSWRIPPDPDRDGRDGPRHSPSSAYSTGRKPRRRRPEGWFSKLLGALRRILNVRVPHTNFRIVPLLLAALLVTLPLFGIYAYNRERGQAFLGSVRTQLPALNAEIHDGVRAAAHFESQAAKLETGRGPETITAYLAAAKSLSERARSSQANLQSIRLRLASFEQLPILVYSPAQGAATAITEGGWYESADRLLKTWRERGETMRKLSEATRDFMGADTGKDFRMDPVGARIELLLRLQALATDIGKISTQLSQDALTQAPDSPAARLSGRFAKLADFIVQARSAVDRGDSATFKSAGVAYQAAAAALREDLLSELRTGARLSENVQETEEILRRIDAAAREIK